MFEDKRLVKRLKRGDREALRQLYEKYKDCLLAIATSLLNDPVAAEDVLHDVFVSLAAGIGRFKFYGSLRSYLITCVINRVRDRFSRRKFEVIELERAGPISSNSRPPEQSVILSEESRLLIEALAAVPFEQREVLILRLHGQMRFREIAAAQRVPVSTAQGRYRYGLDKLRSLMDGELTR
jgi:RNA polymerase sigma-70 factor (ECF subfamily)